MRYSGSLVPGRCLITSKTPPGTFRLIAGLRKTTSPILNLWGGIGLRTDNCRAFERVDAQLRSWLEYIFSQLNAEGIGAHGNSERHHVDGIAVVAARRDGRTNRANYANAF